MANKNGGSDVLLSWLNDAYAMEHALTKILEHRANAAEEFPDLQAMLEQHRVETERHEERVKGCIERHGASPSKAKSVLGTIFGAVEGPMTALAKDEVVKNSLKDYAAENFEVASYRALIAAATELGDQETVAVCQQNLQEDQAMADRLLLAMPPVVVAQMHEMAASSAD